MVSPISLRIKKAEAKANLKLTTFASKNGLKHKKIPKPKKHTSGYSADKDSPTSSVCSMTLGTKSLRAQTVEENSKRRKMEELNYQAFNAKRDMEAGVISKESYNPIVDDTASLRTKMIKDIDLKKVRQIVSRDYDQHNNSNDDAMREIIGNEEEIDYNDLLYSCQHFYSSSGPIPTPSEEETNAIRGQRRFGKFSNHSYSTLSSESGSSTPTPDEEMTTSGISDLFRNNTNEREKTNDNRSHLPTNHFFQCFKQNTMPSNMTLEDAIESGHISRLVVYALNEDADFTIVHCSAAFSRCTGIVSDKLVGQSIQNILQIEDERRSTVTIDGIQSLKPFVLKIISLEKHSCFYVFEFKRLSDTCTPNIHDDDNDVFLSNRVVG
jgi:hypothetical protein